jgi:peroxiredoxin
VRLEGLGKLKKKIHLIGTPTNDLPACSTVPQLTMLPHAMLNKGIKKIVNNVALKLLSQIY